MNIKNRLKKLQNLIIGTDSDFCDCPKETVFKIVPFGESENTPETIICETCRKPIPDPLHATFGINIRIEVIEPTTIYTREEFEEWQDNHVVSQHISYEQYLTDKEAI